VARINIEIPDTLHKKIKSLAIEEDKTIKALIPKILEDYINNNRKD